MDGETIQSYFVSLGFQADNSELRKFEDVLKQFQRIAKVQTSVIDKVFSVWGKIRDIQFDKAEKAFKEQARSLREGGRNDLAKLAQEELENLKKRKVAQEAYGEAIQRVASSTLGTTEALLKAQLMISGVFASISLGVIGLAERLASKDQEYRLFSLRMLMTADAGRTLSMGMDALGASMEEIAWDPELHGRFLQLKDDINEVMAPLKARGIDAALLRVRDFGQEFNRLKVLVQGLGLNFLMSLFEKLGPQIDYAYNKLDESVNWFKRNLPSLGDTLATDVVPILKETWAMLKALGEVTREFGILFMNVIGVLSGDDSLKTTEFSFHGIARAVEHVIGWVTSFLNAMTQAEKVLSHFAAGVGLLFSHKWSEAANEFKTGFAELTPGAMTAFGAVGGAGVGATAGAIGGGMLLGPLGIPLGAAIGGTVGAPAGAGLGYLTGKFKEWAFGAPEGAMQPTSSQASGGQQPSGHMSLLEAIARQEGFYSKGSRPQRDNNPGDIEYGPFAREHGAVGSDGRFAVFPDVQTGFAAMQALLQSKSYSGLSIADALRRWAPSSENDTGAYAQHVQQWTGLDPRSSISDYFADSANMSAQANTAIARDVQAGGSGPANMTQHVTFGPTTVTITQPGLSEEQVVAAIHEERKRTIRADLAQFAYG